MVDVLHFNQIISFHFIRRLVSNGEQTSFWHDVWCGIEPLAVTFPRIYALAADIHAKVQDYRRDDQWIVPWRVPLRGGVVQEQVQHLLLQLGVVRIHSGRDVWRWEIGVETEFSVKLAREHFDLRVLLVAGVKTRWCKLLQRKVNVFLWRLQLGRLPVRWSLANRGFKIDSLMCLVCGTVAEQVSHLFFTCSMAMDMWRKIARWCQVPVPQFADVSAMWEWVDDFQGSAN